MNNFYNRTKAFVFHLRNRFTTAFSYFSKTEWRFFYFFLLVLLISTLSLLNTINNNFLVEIPAYGGKIKEGIIGTPRFVNPALATSDADLDLVSLIYSGLMRKMPNGELVPDLAERYEISEDGKIYTFTLKDEITFHDGENVTADDVIFTINAIQDPELKSPRKGNWDGITATKIDDKTVSFELRQAYASFLQNTTIGIMPEHVWSNSPIELNEANIYPVGSGPFKVSQVNKLSSGRINTYELRSFKKFSLGRPYVDFFVVRFYQNENELLAALSGNSISQANSISPKNALSIEDQKKEVVATPLPRVFGLFFNQNQNQIFLDKNVVNAINLIINKERIVNDVLYSYGRAINSPIPETVLDYQRISATTTNNQEEDISDGVELLAKSGWSIGESGFLEKEIKENGKTVKQILEFSISTSNAEELTRTAELIQQDLGAVGIKVEIKTFETGNLNQIVIRPRKYDALLFGQIINHDSDLFAFWHSSQRRDPGLNVAMYTNSKVDKILEEAFTNVDTKTRIKKYAEFEKEVEKDSPAVFLYSPDFIYVLDKNLQGFEIDDIFSPKDRFSDAYMWYKKVDKVWEIFAR